MYPVQRHRLPAQGPAELLAVGVGMAVQVPLRRQDHARGAEPALRAGVVEERLLEQVQLAVDREPAHGRDLTAVGLDGEHQARVHRLAVEQDGAGPADPLAAAELDLGGAGLGAQQLQQRLVQGDPGLGLPPVDLRDRVASSPSCRYPARRGGQLRIRGRAPRTAR